MTTLRLLGRLSMVRMTWPVTIARKKAAPFAFGGLPMVKTLESLGLAHTVSALCREMDSGNLLSTRV